MSDERELLVEVKTGRRRPMVAEAPIRSSATSGWEGVLLEEHQYSPFENVDVYALNHVVVLHLSSPITLEWRHKGRYRPISIHPNRVSVVPAELNHSARSLDSGRCLLVSVQPRLLAGFAWDMARTDRLELAPAHDQDDPLVQGICLSLKNELDAGSPGGRAYTQALGSALAMHLVQKYSVQKPRVREYQGGLSKARLRQATEFIQAHLEQDIGLNAIAAAAGLSPYHFSRMFKRSTGMAPHQYLVRSRVERAREMLLRFEGTIADVAIRTGFCDQSHLTCHFRRAYGVTPKKFLQEIASPKIVV